MGYGDYYWGLYRDYYKDPFPHSLLRTRQIRRGRADTTRNTGDSQEKTGHDEASGLKPSDLPSEP